MYKKLNESNYLIFDDEESGAKIIFIASGFLLKCVVIEKNELPPGSDEWSNKEIEDYLLIKKYSE